ncbi:alpha/beta hydrolase [Paraburkholderia bengalensis]|uniref:Alpha/beta hydrolase n=2 Tax=Paraburkholderia bengalensis TaxID=2747562 RepID=A0ABU8IN58_9BURK
MRGQFAIGGSYEQAGSHRRRVGQYRLLRIKANTLVMSGRYDRLNTVQDGQECASLISDVQVVEMKRSGHFPNVEKPTIYVTLLHEFLACW